MKCLIHIGLHHTATTSFQQFLYSQRDYLIKLKDNILSKDFSILGEAPKEDMMKMKRELYMESIKESK